MVATSYVRGHEVYYDEEEKFWKYKENNKRVDEKTVTYCSKCNKPEINGADFCMQGLLSSDFIISACCGHGVHKGFIKLADGRTFKEVGGDD